MNVKPKHIFWAFGIIAVIGVVLSWNDLFNVKAESEEGQLMSAACQDVKTHEILRAENDFDKILEVIYSHLYSYRDQSDTILTQAVGTIANLREEAVFRNTDQKLYHRKFANTLIQLGYLELEDATYYIETKDMAHAKTAVNRAKHYIHDALIFSENPDFDKHLELLHMINRLNEDDLEVADLKLSLKKARSFI